MNLSAHVKSLNNRKNEIDAEIIAEMQRPMPDFIYVSELKKRKLVLKQQIESLETESVYA